MLLQHSCDWIYYFLVSFLIFNCVFIPVWVFTFLLWQIFTFDGITSIDSSNDVLEIIWTVLPFLVVLVLVIFNVSYSLYSHNYSFGYCVKVIGHQWYWSYETPDQNEYDSIMSDLLSGVDKPLRLFFGVPCNLLVTSADVIHSFSIPDLGIKIDAIPGRINQGDLFPCRLGIFSGYCTELCGAGHAYMPVVLEVVYNHFN